jgi:hypothetical protein
MTDLVNNSDRVSDLEQALKSSIATSSAEEAAFKGSTIGKIEGNTPTGLANVIMGSRNPAKDMADLMDRIKSNPSDVDGLKASIRDWLKNRLFNTENVGTGNSMETKASNARFSGLDEDARAALNRLYGQEAMKSFYDVREQLSFLSRNASAGGSETAQHLMLNDRLKAVAELVIREGLPATTGTNSLRAAGLWKSLSIFARTINYGTEQSQANAVMKVIAQALTDPDAAVLLLNRKVGLTDIGTWNRQLAIRAGIASNNQNEDETNSEEKGLVIDINGGGGNGN